jgi:hypothetical protein
MEADMSDTLFRTTRSAVIAVLSRFRPSDRGDQELRRIDKRRCDDHGEACLAMDGIIAAIGGSARSLREQIHASGRETDRLMARLADATTMAEPGLAQGIQDLFDQSVRLRVQLEHAVEATQATWEGHREAIALHSERMRSGIIAARRSLDCEPTKAANAT